MTSIHTPVVLWCWVGLWIVSHSWLCINGPSEPCCLRDVCVCRWVNHLFFYPIHFVWKVCDFSDGLFGLVSKFLHWTVSNNVPNISLKYIQQNATFSRSIYFYKLLYMFQAVPPPIIRSTKLYIQRQVLSNQYCCLLLSWMRWN